MSSYILKIRLEKNFIKPLYKLHREVFINSLNKQKVDINVYKSKYIKLYNNLMLNINNTFKFGYSRKDIEFYNETFTLDNVDAMIDSLVKFYVKRDIEVKNALGDTLDDDRQDYILSTLGWKAANDIQYAVQNNANNQQLGSEVVKKQDNYTYEEIIAAMYAGELIDTDLKKKWRAIMDNKTRHDHRAVNGQVKPINKAFIVGGSRLKFPGDYSLGAKAKQVANCRCDFQIVK